MDDYESLDGTMTCPSRSSFRFKDTPPPPPPTHPQPIHAQELCERRGGRHGLPVTNSPYRRRGRTATMNLNSDAQNSVAV